MRITLEDARQYFQHHTQQKWAGIAPDDLPGEPFQYWANGGVCGVFHPDHWPGVWMAHYGVKPEAWGRATEPAKAILNAFWEAEKPRLIIGWTDEANRAALAFAKRIGFTVTGRMSVGIIMQEWQP